MSRGALLNGHDASAIPGSARVRQALSVAVSRATPGPGGENAPGYRLAFQAWMLLFLLTLCVGLLNYLGSYLKSLWQ